MIEWIIIFVMYYIIGILCGKLLDIAEGTEAERCMLPIWLKTLTDLFAPVSYIQKLVIDFKAKH